MNKPLINIARTNIALGIALVCANVAFALPTQTPLLTRGSMVAPNIVYMIDDSGSMDADYLYQEATSAAWGGQSLNISNGMGVNPNNTDYAKCSPQINQLYYDPTTYYPPPFNNAGVRIANVDYTTMNKTSPTNTQWGGSQDNVCTATYPTTIGQPRIFNYKGGNGPNWSGGYVLNSFSSYTTVDIVSTNNSYTKYPGRTDCAGSTCTYIEEATNFGNWYKWYRTRIGMAKTSTIEAFAGLPATFRLGWGKLNTLGTSSGGPLTEGTTTFDSAKRTKFIDFVNGLGSNGNTPSKLAYIAVAKYFQRTDTNGPWSNTPSATVSPLGTIPSNLNTAYATCRRANVIYMTDGYYNDGYWDAGEYDAKTGVTLPTVTASSGGQPYDSSYPLYALTAQSSKSGTFADIAMKYWMTDLVPGLDNKVTPITGTNQDPAFWQHLNFYAIGLGVVGTLNPGDADKAAITAGTKAWPSTTLTDNDPTTLDDMWHATINARGAFLNAGNSTQLTAAINSMMGQMLKASSSQAGVAVSTVNLDTGTAKYVPTYTTGTWVGNLIAYTLDNTTVGQIGKAIMPPLWQAETMDSTTGLETNNTLCPYPADARCPTPSTSAATLTRANNRNIVVGNGATSGTRAIPFMYTNMSSAGIASSITAAYTGQLIDQTLIDFLRGDKSQEGTNGTRSYRIRTATLGDIVNSTPAFVKFATDYGYSSQAGYTAFLATKAARSEGAIFFGANDGMLHTLAESNGREVFAYVPKAVLPNIAQLAAPGYGSNNNHLYFVDGPLTQGDYYSSTASAWRNVVIGTTGAGAKAVFALDVTNPTSMDASKVLWEISSTTSGFSELGNVLTDVQIGRMRDGSWAAIFGNGYASTSGKAQLFIVNIDTGALIRVIDTGAGSTTTPNGLGGVRLVLDTSGIVMGAYAGDLLGNMWKFDLSSAAPGSSSVASSTSWGVGFGTSSTPKPLYIAKDASGTLQPFTAAPSVMPHPYGGYLVAMATGKLFEDTDLNNVATQSVYGVQDTILFGAASLPNPTTSQIATTTRPTYATPPTSTPLVQQVIGVVNTINQTITAFDGTTSTQAITFYSVSTNVIDWSTKSGWFFDLPNSGQRTVYPVDSLVSSGAASRLVRVDTLQPGGVASDPCASSTSAIGTTYIIDTLTGGSPQGTLLDTNGDGTVIDSTTTGIATGTTAGSADTFGASGYTTAADGRNISVVRTQTSNVTTKDIYDISSSGDARQLNINICSLKLATSADETSACCQQGVVSYCTPIKRSWRQLFMRQ